MTLNINGNDIQIIGYDEYVEKFDVYVLPEYRGSAEECLIEELESYFEPKYEINYVIYVEKEKTRVHMDMDFYFVYLCEEECLKFISESISVFKSCKDSGDSFGYPKSLYYYNLDTYFKNFEELIKPEYGGAAESLLLEELENINLENSCFSVCVDGEKAKNGKNVVFTFSVVEVEWDEPGYCYDIEYRGKTDFE